MTDEDRGSEEGPPSWTVVWWHWQAGTLLGPSRGIESTVFSGLFVFVHEEAKAIDLGRAESFLGALGLQA